ncbi:MAG TPA: LuxR C-terminal-related transcriptional regulator, partial [Microbacteriaceae bacterium]|nr:LuxR C-terminal-related transcriptional regulator [Microbacteriaceae bacterium]
IEGDGEDALKLLARSVSTLSLISDEIILPETPAALTALVAIGRGEPHAAQIILEKALKTSLGGEAGRRRHTLLHAWSLMVQGHLDVAEKNILEFKKINNLCDRDHLLYGCILVGLARRRTDITSMREAWEMVREQTFGIDLTLYDLLPLGEMLVTAARLRDLERLQPFLKNAVAILQSLNDPIAWSAPLHWHAVQAAFQVEDPSALIPHANALVKAEKVSSYAATLAQAGNTWLEVLRREANFDSVTKSVRALAKSGQVWDAARLAGQAALQHPEREEALSMMQLAREINKEQLNKARTLSKSSVLTARELEVGRLVLDGQGYRAIGEQLFISPKTVEHHVARIRNRLGATSRGQLIEKLHDVVNG